MLRFALPFVFASSAALADVPKVVTDIAPIHSLVAAVMNGVGDPQLVVAPGTSPHHHAMRPSEAAMLAEADLVVWVGPKLTPWLEGPIENLAARAVILEMMDVEGIQLLNFRDGALFEGHDNGHDKKTHKHDIGHEHDDEHAHEKHAHGHDEMQAEDDDDHGHGHAAGEVDPHVWLDPFNAQTFLVAISETLSQIDPANAQTYAANAAQTSSEISDLSQRIEQELGALTEPSFIVLHDGFHYFEHRFGIEAFGAIADGHASTPGAARITKLRATLKDTGVRCAFTEPQVGTELLEVATEGLDVRVGVLDPTGTLLETGAQLYLQLLEAMADEMARCLAR